MKENKFLLSINENLFLFCLVCAVCAAIVRFSSIDFIWRWRKHKNNNNGQWIEVMSHPGSRGIDCLSLYGKDVSSDVDSSFWKSKFFLNHPRCEQLVVLDSKLHENYYFVTIVTKPHPPTKLHHSFTARPKKSIKDKKNLILLTLCSINFI